MKQVSLGKYRALGRASTLGDHFAVLAIDHTDALRWAMNPGAPETVTTEEVVAFKRQVISALAPELSGVLLDPIYSAPQAVHGGYLATAGLLVEMEKTEYQLKPMPLECLILPGWSVAKIKRMGADGVKLFYYYNPDDPELAARQDALLRQVTGDCAANDIPLYAEPILYPIGEDQAVYVEKYTQRVIEMARRADTLGADILKLEFPVPASLLADERRCRDACAELSAAVDRPWVLLSAGVSFDTFCRQVEIACASGASGFIVGRAVWDEAAHIANEQARQSWLESTGRNRIRQLCDAVLPGLPWTSHIVCKPVSTDWYMTYGDNSQL